MDSVTRIRATWVLRRQGVGVADIVTEVGRDRSTVYHWLQRIRRYGIEGYIKRYRRPRKGVGYGKRIDISCSMC
jgi:transposase